MSVLLERLADYDQRIALIDGTTTYSYAQLLKEVNKLELRLNQQDIQPGEVVAILGEFSFANIALFLALSRHRTIIVPITPMPEHEIQDRLEAAYVDWVFSYGQDWQIQRLGGVEKHAMIRSLQTHNSAGLVLFSSGSTGKPKAMIHDLDRLLAHYQDKKAKQLNMLLFLMFDHIGGLNSLLNVLCMGATGIITQKREVGAVCELIAAHQIKVLPASPTFLNLMLMSGVLKDYDLSALRMITYGTEAMPSSLLQRLKTQFPKVKLLQTFGTSETGIANTASLSSDSTFMKIDDKDLEYKIVEGELWLKSKTQILGYLNTCMESFEEGWFKTGDLVEVIDNGYLRIIGRNKQVINVGGQKVIPGEVESAILEWPEFSDVLVYGENNAITGQNVCAKVCCSNSTMTAKEAKKRLRQYLKNRLEPFKIPTKVEVVESLAVSDRFKKVRL